jgi:hypothetical protein
MKNKHKKLYLVSREVMASSIRDAISSKGKVYRVELAEDKFQPEEDKKLAGFSSK